MISTRFIKYLLVAIVGSLLFNLLLALKGEALGALDFLASCAFGITFHCLAVVRLPLFRDYFYPDPLSFDRSAQGYPNNKAVPVMSALLTGCIGAMLCLALNGANIAGLALCAACAAGLMSFYMPDSSLTLSKR